MPGGSCSPAAPRGSGTRNAVGERRDRGALQDGARDILLRVLHLLGGAVLELEADVVEQEQRNEPEEVRQLERVELPGGVAVLTPCSMA